jgi:hypothetical protein
MEAIAKSNPNFIGQQPIKAEIPIQKTKPLILIKCIEYLFSQFKIE